MAGLLEEAADRIGEPAGEAARCLFGFAAGTRGEGLKVRRSMAATAYSVSFHSFREKGQRSSREKTTVEQMADAIIDLYNEARLRQVHRELEHGSGSDEKLAFQWVKRFESYFRIWTPAWNLAADLTAYRSTLLEPIRPWTRDPAMPPASDEQAIAEQAAGYARFALYAYAMVEWELKRFKNRHGGLWLLSDAEAEVEVADALYRIGWHMPWNERDLSWLRMTLQAVTGQELHGFLSLLAEDGIGRATHDEWLAWCAGCECRWEDDGSTEAEHFPTFRKHQGIGEACALHQVVAACGDYCDIIEREWRRIADAFHLSDVVRRGVSPEMLYRQRTS